MAEEDDEEGLLRSVALQNATVVRLERQRAEEELRRAKDALEAKTRELAHALAMMKATLESTTDGILVTDGAGNVTGFNEIFVRMWGLSSETMGFRDHQRVLEANGRLFDDPGAFIARAREIYASAWEDSYDLLELSDGSVFERFSRPQLLDDRNVGRVWSVRDITARRRAEEALAKQAEWLRVTLGSIGDAVITTDTAGRVTYLNEVAEALTGWTNAQASGEPMERVFDIVNETTRQRVENPAAKALREGRVVGLANHTILVAKDGTERPIDDSAAPILDDQGRVAGVVLVFRDVTAHRAAERALQRQAALSAFEAEIGVVLAQSESLEPMLSRAAELMIRHLDAASARIWTLDEQDDVLELRASAGMDTRLDARHGRVVIGDGEIGSIAAERRPLVTNTMIGDPRVSDQAWAAREGLVAFAGYPLLADSKLVGVVALVAGQELGDEVDESMRLVANSIALAVHQKQQAQRLRELAATLSDADRRKNEFLAMLAHELRNPLAPIHNSLHVVRKTQGCPEPVTVASAIMERQVAQMVRLVDDLLDVSRISRGAVELRRRRIDLRETVEHAVEAARSLCETMGHRLEVSLPGTPIFVDGDATRLLQVVGNLLSNACKFTDASGRVSLSLGVEDGEAVVRVRDSGIGISAEQLPRIFDMFVQADTSLERTVSGLGIGLTVVRRLVEMHGGTVSVRSAGLGHGSEFAIRLPVVTEGAAVDLPLAADETDDIPPLRILVVDDNRDSAESLAMLLELEGNETRIAYDGAEAVDVAEKFRPDVVLSDIGLPKLNGYEACRRIRQEPWGKDIVMVALTGWGQEEDRERSRNAGFGGHLVKPVDLVLLKKVLAGLHRPGA